MATRQGLSQSTFNLIVDTFHFIPGSISEISIGRNTRSSGSDNDMHALFPPLIVREVSLLLHPPLNLKGIEIIFDRFVSSKKKKKERKERKKNRTSNRGFTSFKTRFFRGSTRGYSGHKDFLEITTCRVSAPLDSDWLSCPNAGIIIATLHRLIDCEIS